MTLSSPTRIPIIFGASPAAMDVVLPEFAETHSQHGSGCACCGAREPAAVALDSLFVARVRGNLPWFDRVIAPPGAEAAVRAAVCRDPVTAARFRLA